MLGQGQLVGDGKGARGGGEGLGDQQPSPVRVEAAGPFHHDLGRHDPDREAVTLGQTGAGADLEPLAPDGGVVREQGVVQGLAEGVEFGEMVAAGLDMVTHPVGGRLRVDDHALSGLGLFAGAAVGEGPVQADQGVGCPRGVVDQLQNLVARHRQAAEDRIGQDLGQFSLAGRTGLLGQGAQVDVIGVGQTQQELGRNRPLVALYVVEITGGNAKIGGHGRLGQVHLAAQPLEAAAEEKLAISGRVHSDSMSRCDSISTVTL